MGTNMSRFVLNQKGSSLLEMVILSAVMLALLTSFYSLAHSTNRQTEIVRSLYDYRNALDELKTDFAIGKDCSANVGNDRYDGVLTNLRQITISGVTYNIGDRIRGTSLTIDRIQLLPMSGVMTPMTFIVGGVTENLRHRRTRLRLIVNRSGFPLKQIDLPVSIYSRSPNEKIERCAANDESEHCFQAGGIMKLNTAGQPKCDILPAIGGCAKGGTFSLTDNNCTVGNPYTGACTCPTGFTAYLTGSLAISKDATMTQKECLFCSGGVTPVVATALLPLFDENAVQDQLLCTQNLALCQACQTDPTSQTCICGRNPADPACTQPSACTTYGIGSCPCLSEQMNVQCAPNFDYSTEPCASAYADAMACYSFNMYF